MSDAQSTVVVTGVAGNLGLRLLPQLADFRVVGIDLQAPQATQLYRFEALDLGEESSCDALIELVAETQASAVVHLAFVLDPLRTGILDLKRMWQINVAGTARVMEAIAAVNRLGTGRVRQFIFPSSVSAYGPDLSTAVDELAPLEAHTLPYAVHKRVADEVVQARAEELGSCRTYLLRPHIFCGASMQNYMVGALRGTPTGNGGLGKWLRKRGSKLPVIVPSGRRYFSNKIQFVHVDDMARLLAHILKNGQADAGITVMNVAGRGDSLSFEECLRIARAKCLRLPGKFLCRETLKLFWSLGISGVPPEALPYFTGSYAMNTTRLRSFLGESYEKVMQYTVRDALADSFRATPENLSVAASASVSAPVR